jgi:hypothetical protein
VSNETEDDREWWEVKALEGGDRGMFQGVLLSQHSNRKTEENCENPWSR